MGEYPLRVINKRLRTLGAKSLERQGSHYVTTYLGTRISGIPVSHGRTKANQLLETYVQKLARDLAIIEQREGGTYNRKYFLNVLKGRQKVKRRKGLEDILVFLLIFSGLSIFSGKITGFSVLQTVEQKSLGVAVMLLFLGLLTFIVKKAQ